METGFIGLGLMGRPMALNLLKAGHRVHVWSRRRESMQPLLDAGAGDCASAAEVARHSDVVISMVADAPDVEAVALGPDGVADGARDGLIFVDMSTIAPAAAQSIAARLAERGVTMLDAPVSGGEAGAIEATLTIMVGGDAAAFERVRPLFEAMGRTVSRIGASGAGQVAKACNQMVMVSTIQACAEAMLLARAHGVDLEALRGALMGGSAASRMLELMGGRMVRRDFGNGIQARLHHKDFGIALDEAVSLGVPLPVAVQVWQQLNALMGHGWGREDTSSLLRVLEAATGRAAD